jgi:hypothetical protein
MEGRRWSRMKQRHCYGQEALGDSCYVCNLGILSFRMKVEVDVNVYLEG